MLINNILNEVGIFIDGITTSIVTLVTFAVTGNPATSVVVGGGTNVIVEKLPPFNQDPSSQIIDGATCTTPECLQAFADQQMWITITNLGTTWGLYVIGAFLLYSIIVLLIGKYGMKSRKEVKMERKLFNCPDTKIEDIE